MDGRRNFTPEPDADSRWYPDDRGYDERGYDDRRDDRGERADRSRDLRAREGGDRGYDGGDRGYGDDQRGYGEDRGYTPTRYADERDYGDGYRAPEPRGGGRGYAGDSLGAGYDDSPSGQFGAPARSADPGDLSGEFGGGRSRRSEAIDRGALQRPVSGGGANPGFATTSAVNTSGAPVGGLGAPGGALGAGPTAPLAGGAGPVSGAPASGGPVGPGGPGGGMGSASNAFAAPTALTAAVPPPQQQPIGPGEPGGAVYHSKRPGLAIVLGLLAVVFEIPVLRLFFSAMTADKIEAGATLSGMFMIPALPMFAMGLYGLIGGAAAAAPGARAWMRTPLAYLPVALLLFVAAGLAA